jgi:Ca2+-binding RTX toxin-like protein
MGERRVPGMLHVGVAFTGLIVGGVASLGLLPAAAQTCEFRTRTGDDTRQVWTDTVGYRDTWYLRGGNDYGRSLACDDPAIYGEDGPDDIGGGSGNDFVLGGNQADAVYGGQGDDGLSGDAGNDNIYDLEGPNTGAPSDVDLGEGKGGDDRIEVRDGDLYDLAVGGAGTGGMNQSCGCGT